MSKSPEHRLQELIADQHGVFSRRQAEALGVPPRNVVRRIERGRWIAGVGAVVRDVAAPRTWMQRCHEAVLVGREGAAVSRMTALALFGSRRFPDAPIDVIVPHPRNVRAAGVAYHSTTDLDTGDVVMVQGLPATRPARSLLDLAGSLTLVRLGLVFDDVVTAGIVEPEAVASCLQRHLRPGKRGLAKLATVLDERLAVVSVSESVLEARFLSALRSAGLPMPLTQFDHPSPERDGNRVDFAWPGEQLIVEVDGRSWHSRVRDLRRDHDRDRAAARAGWQTLRVLGEHLDQDRMGVVDDVSEVLRQRTRRAA